MSLLLLLLILVPLAGAVVGAFLPQGKLARYWALLVSIVTLGISLALLGGFDLNQNLDDVKPSERLERTIQVSWPENPRDAASVQQIGFSVRLGLDTVAYWLVLLTTVLMPLSVAASFHSIRERQTQYYAWMLALLGFMLGVFLARDALLFYVFFELTLVPMYFIIGIWGGSERRYAANKFFLFTFAGGVLTLAGVVWLGLRYGSFDIFTIIRGAQGALPSAPGLSSSQQLLVLLALLAGFAVKIPLFPVHTWLPLAHTEAPTAGSVILAGVLLKLGTYGLLRLALPIGLVGTEPDWINQAIAVLALLCIVGIVYGALVAWVQKDIKKLVAYSSVSHLGFCVLGLVAMNTIGLQSSVMYMINHGISTGAMFLLVGMIYDRFHTRDINALSGLGRRMPILGFFFGLFVFSSIGLPGTNGFVSEFLSILAAFTSDRLGPVYAALAATGVVLGAVYMLHLTACVLFGPLKIPAGHAHHQHDAKHDASDDELPADLNGREIAILTPLAVLVIVLGVLPSPVLRSMEAPLKLAQQPTAMLVSTNPPTGVAAIESGAETVDH
jgi:NADH-quinone oxidoreductase subunit M